MTGARKMLLVSMLSMGLAACAQTDNRALSESALANTGDNVTWQSLNDEVSGVKASQLTDLINLDDIAHMSSFIEEALQHNANLQQTLITLQKAQVVIGNIIRNAYQHIQCGSVAISLRDNQLKVVNEEQKEAEQKENEQDASKALATANLPGNGTSLVNSSNAAGVKRNANVNNSEKSASGFGIGLKLLDKLTGKLNWAYQQRATSNGVLVTLVLETH